MATGTEKKLGFTPAEYNLLIQSAELLELVQVGSSMKRGRLLDEPGREFELKNVSKFRWELNKAERALAVFTWIEAVGASGDDVALEVQAEYRAVYRFGGDFDFNPPEALLKVFCTRQGAAHAWPFWREFLSQSSGRMGAPTISAPLFHYTLMMPDASSAKVDSQKDTPPVKSPRSPRKKAVKTRSVAKD